MSDTTRTTTTEEPRERKPWWKPVLVVIGLLLLALLLAQCVFSSSDGNDPVSSPTRTVTETAEPTSTPTVTKTAEPEPLGQGQLGKDLKDLLPNATKDDVRFGNDVKPAKNKVETGASDFHDKGEKLLKTRADIKAWFASDDPKAKAAKERVTKAIRDAGYGDEEVQRALSGKGYIKMQLKPASQIMGTSYFVDGKVKVLNEWRQAESEDMYWLYVTEDMRLIKGALLRYDCINPGADTIRIVTPNTPPAPSVTCYSKCKPPKPPEGGCKYNCDNEPPCKYNCDNEPPCKYNCKPGKNPADHPANNGNGPPDPWTPAPEVKDPPSNPGGGAPPEQYTPPPAPEPTKEPRPAPPPPKETSAPPPDKPEPKPTKDPCEVNPDWC